MLLKFWTQNYRSFKDGFVFSLEPVRQKKLEYSILKERIGGKTYEALSAAVIFGPNASGKTAIIEAMDTMRRVVLRGNIQDDAQFGSSNVAASNLSLIPFAGASAAPVSLGIAFVHEGIRVDYSISMDVGAFLQGDDGRKIVSETLLVNQKEVFCRGEKLVLDGLRNIRPLLNDSSYALDKGVKAVAEASLVPTDLFLTNGFKTIYSKQLCGLITEWFQDKLLVLLPMKDSPLGRRFPDPSGYAVSVERTLSEAAKAFGVRSNALGYTATGPDGEAMLHSRLQVNGTEISVPAEAYESNGTLWFLEKFPYVMQALKTGATLVVDELDASLHPMAVMNLINVFHCDEINVRHAQLVFDTHNPIFLHAGFLRRDEIKFVDRDDESHVSSHYALSDFKIPEKESRRKQEDYLKEYFLGRYGAIKDIDFSPLVERIVCSGDGEAAKGLPGQSESGWRAVCLEEEP